MSRIETFEKLFHDYYAPLCNFANKYLHDWDASQDMVQTSFLKIWKNWDAFESSTSQKSYIFQTVKHTVLDYIKKEDRKAKREETYNGLNTALDNSLDSYVIKHEIMRSLDKLKPKIRKIFILNKIEGLTYPEIAQYLAISERSVEDNMSKAFKALRADLFNNPLLKK